MGRPGSTDGCGEAIERSAGESGDEVRVGMRWESEQDTRVVYGLKTSMKSVGEERGRRAGGGRKGRVEEEAEEGNGYGCMYVLLTVQGEEERGCRGCGAVSLGQVILPS